MKYLLLVLCLFSSIAFADGMLEYQRHELPQLNEEILAGSDYPFELKRVPLSFLIPVQVDRVPNLKKHEKRLIKAAEDTYRPLVIDHNFYIIDGHHRYDALTEMGVETVRVFQVHADIQDVIVTFAEHQDHQPTVRTLNLEEVVVTGSRGTLESAIDKEEASDNLVSVVDSDALGSFADSTGADAVSRLSGISVENDQGEGRYVTVRGLSSDLNSVSVNGASMVAPENGRSVIMDGIPTELLDSIEVAKTLTPEMDADAIGGRISFNTKRPSELDDTFFKINVATKFAEFTDYRHAPNFSITYGDLINDNTGHIIGLTYSNRYITSYNNETGFGWEDGFLNDDWEMRYYEVQRERYGFSYDISTDFGDTMLYAGVFYNMYDESEVRLKNEYGKIDNDGFVTSRIRHDAETRVRYETREIGAANFGFESQVSDWYVDGQFSYSWAEEDDSDNADITFRNYDKTYGGEFDATDPRRLSFTAYDPTLRDPSNLEFDAFEMWSNVSQDAEWSIQFNAERDLSSGSILKVGAKYREREKDVDDYIIAYEWDKTLADFDNYTIDWRFQNQTFGNHLTPGATYGLRDQIDMMSIDFSDGLSRDFTTNEDIGAVYAQVTTEWDNTVMITGLRYEYTQWESRAFDQDGMPTSARNDYDFLAPSVTVKHYMNDNVQLRAALWTSLSRPGFKETAPITDVDVDGDEVTGSVGNPELKPYESINFDASIAYYGDGMTFASAGVFRKEIQNAIYPTFQRTGTFNGITFTDGVETWINAGDSWINGLELNAQYGWDNGLYVAANVTLTESESEFTFDGEQTFTTDFRKLAGEAGNISLGFDNGVWDARLAVNHRGDFIDWFADEDGDITELNENNTRYVDSHTQVDVTVKYHVNDNLTLRGEIVNLTDEPEYYYWGNPNQLSQYDEFGVSYSVGFTYQL
jgi:TonB-dependent receptor